MYGGILFFILLIPPIRTYLESVMIVHMLVQIPLLIIAGWFAGIYLQERFPKFFVNWNENGVPGIIFIVFVTMYWMIPRAVDDALTFPIVEVFKYISLPLVGILLKDSWGKIKGLGRAFIFLNYLSMFGIMGWLYVDSPIQICNNYLIAEQKMLGWGFIGITAVMVIGTIVYVFSDHSSECQSG